jgi:hypothetical protein
LTITNGGCIGIGNTSPEARLTLNAFAANMVVANIKSSTGNNLFNFISNDTPGHSILDMGRCTESGTFAAGYIRLRTDGNSWIQGGNLSIGTTSSGNFNGLSFAGPFLDVAGIIQVKGTSSNGIAGLQFGGDTYRKAIIYSSVGTDEPYLAFGVSTNGSSSSATERVRITCSGNILPGANGTQDLGSSTCRWCTVYTSDLSLNNGIGNYTIVEGENDLFIYNNNSCKVYKFLLQEVCPEMAPAKRSI